MKRIYIRNSRKIITLQLLSMHYYTRTALMIEVLFNYSNNSSRNIVDIILLSD